MGNYPDATAVFDVDAIGLVNIVHNLNRGLGLPDGYPFVLSAPALDKLRFVHETISAAASVPRLGSAVGA